MNIDDEGKRCFEEDEETSSKGFFLTRRYSDSMGVEQEADVEEYSWEMSKSSEQRAEQVEYELEVREDKLAIDATDDRGRRSGANTLTRKKILETMEKSGTKRSSETKLVLATASLNVKREVQASGSGKLNAQKSKLRTPKSPVEKFTPQSSAKMMKSDLDTEIGVKVRSPSPVRAKCAKLSDNRNIATGKPGSPSPTRMERSKQLSATEKVAVSRVIRRSKLVEELGNNTIACQMIEFDGSITAESESMMEALGEEKRKRIVLDFDEFPPPRSEKRSHVRMHPDFLNVPPEPGFYLSPIKENSETSAGSEQSKVAAENFPEKMEATLEYDHTRKYHTYPKSRIPVARWSKERRIGNLMMDPKMYPLEPREVDLEAFQQLHTADSQEELQEFLLLESQCSGNLGLAGNMSTSEVSCSDHHSEDERGTMSDY